MTKKARQLYDNDDYDYNDDDGDDNNDDDVDAA